MRNLQNVGGLVLGGGLLAGCLILAKIPLQPLFHPLSWLLVLGGIGAALLLSYPFSVLASCFSKVFGLFVWGPATLHQTRADLVELSRFARANGLLGLNPLLPELEQRDFFLAKGLRMVLDQIPVHRIQTVLHTEMEQAYRFQLDEARVFESAGGYAPTMGLLGAILGLIQAMSQLENTTLLGQGVAGAFSATLLGLALANLLFLPLAAQLRQQARHEWVRTQMKIQALLSMNDEEHPVILEERLQAYSGNRALAITLEATTSARSLPTPEEKPMDQWNERHLPEPDILPIFKSSLKAEGLGNRSPLSKGNPDLASSRREVSREEATLATEPPMPPVPLPKKSLKSRVPRPMSELPSPR
jgi:chemotaxis protein MotA